MAIDDKERIHFRGRGPRGERKARKLNALVEMIQRAAPAKAGHVNVRVRQTDAGSVFSAKARGETGTSTPSEIRTFRGSITISNPPHPTLSEIVDAIVSAYGSTQPQVGDYVILTSSTRAPFFARALPQDESDPNTDFGLSYRNIEINSVTQRFLIAQTGTFF